MSERPLHWPNHYEKEADGTPIAPEHQYGGGGPMSEDYQAAMRSMAFVGIEEPWGRGQIERFGYPIIPAIKRATYINPHIEQERI